MIILSVMQSKKHLVSVKTDEDEYLIDLNTVYDYGLRKGLEVSREKMDEIRHKSDVERAKSRGVWLLSMRAYSAAMLAKKLYADCEKEAVDEAICELTEQGFIDDTAYAKALALELCEYRHMSRRNVRMELQKRGVDRDIIDEAVEELPEDEVPAILEVIRQKYACCFDDEKGRRRMFAGLARKGYGYDDIKQAIEQYNDNENNDNERDFD